MTKKEMEERITKLEAQVELLSHMVPQFSQRQPQPCMPAPRWQPMPSYAQYQPFPDTGPVKPDGTRSY